MRSDTYESAEKDEQEYVQAYLPNFPHYEKAYKLAEMLDIHAAWMLLTSIFEGDNDGKEDKTD